MLKDKTIDINLGIQKIQEFLSEYRPEKHWDIAYYKMDDPAKYFDAWTIGYHGIISEDEYIFIFDDSHLLYALNVTGNSVLYTMSELMRLLANKF